MPRKEGRERWLPPIVEIIENESMVSQCLRKLSHEVSEISVVDL